LTLPTRLLDAYTANLLAGEDELADGIRAKIERLFEESLAEERTGEEAQHDVRD